MKRITMLAAAGALVVTPALGAWSAFAASDDGPLPHVRAVDRRGEPEPGDDHGRHHRHRADDGARHARHGADDSSAHRRHSGEPEPGDDHGRHHRHGADDGPRHDRHGGDD
jgi:hypothetical protein